MDLESARSELVQEARDLLATIEDGLLSLERTGSSHDTLHAVFRAAHTLKGSAGIFGLEILVAFTHTIENVLDALRSNQLQLTPELSSILLEGKDMLSSMIDALAQGEDNPDPDPARREELRRRLSEIKSGKVLVPASPRENAKSADSSMAAKATVNTELDPAMDSWHLSLRLNPDCLRQGIDPLALFEHLERLGKILYFETLTDHLPSPNEMNPDTLYLGYEIQFLSKESRTVIESAFEFVREGSSIQLLAPGSTVAQYLDLIKNLEEPQARIGEILVACGALSPAELEKGLQVQANQPPGQHQPLGRILVEEVAVHPLVVETAVKKQQQEKSKSEAKRPTEHRFIKVEVEKLDALVNQVGELVIAGAAASLAAHDRSISATIEAMANVQKLIEGVRDASLSLRMVPIGEVFQRFPRVVRDISKNLGKKIDLVIEGADTELDKSMVERLVDPLTHMIRNAIDHGIESIEKRTAKGKSETGTVKLNAWHEGSSILIEVADDGAGLDSTKILAKAQERGIVKPGQELTQREILQLIFEAGFSTAEKVTDLSGRGVGMDVVKRNIDDMRGVVEVDTQEGKGSSFRIRLPLTLAIIDGFQFLAGGSTWVVPLDQVVECNDLSEAETYQGLVRLRGEPLPFFRLRELFGIAGEPPARESLVVVQHGSQHVGIAVDELIGELQAVIKPLGKLFRQVRGIGGTTILGNGQLAMILDIGQLVALNEEKTALRAH